jgi:RNA polymerase sigma-70 factor (ECF subfamily)
VDRGSSNRRRRFEDLFARHGTAVYAYARRRSTAADAEEVVAETFLVAWRRLDALPAEALPWLLAVARRTLANKRRGDDRRTALHLRLATAAAPASQSTSESLLPGDTELSDRVTYALRSLPPGEHDALTLLAWDGLTPAEIATVLGCTRGAVHLRLFRARRRLRQALSDPTDRTHPEGDPR